MKLNLSSSAFILALLIIFFFMTSSSGLSLAAKTEMAQKREPSHAAGEDIVRENPGAVMQELEFCHDEDGECVQQRFISEAHLDYIYTQPHKP